uniref:Uncharacterized protein n=1 Tax=Tanacetum cinerariifolium TaxID=118510 RepID=A0A6L2LNP0_TANCI|nr:hypothetical protein [Tanacetum cinerariifolium]
MLDALLVPIDDQGAKDPIFGMPIPMVMLNDEIQDSDAYLEYLIREDCNCSGTKEIKETGQSEKVADMVDYEETKEKEEPLIIRRQIGVTIGKQSHRESEERN